MQFSDGPATDEGWETISRDIHFADGHLKVATEEVLSPECERSHRWTVVQRKRAVVIAPLTVDARLVLIRQERVPIRAAIWEVPAGQIDASADAEIDEIAAVALRELREETGYQLATGGELLPLGDFFSSPGFTDERGFCFLARHVELSGDGHNHQESESILDCRTFTGAELKAMILRNDIRDANTLSICAKLLARGMLAFSGSGNGSAEFF
ncbi:MAG: NUDIX hydrolase [Chthoniobacterales bacterium]|nr:NUDIX hydrolase [Chthoniobacterales bacterium]